MFKKLFSTNQLETIEKLEKEFDNLLKKSKSDFICLVGVEGKVKGLEVVVKLNEDSGLSKKGVQRINVKLVEYYLRFKSLPIEVSSTNDPEDEFKIPLRHICYNFGEAHKYYIIPFELNKTLIVTAQSSDIDRILKGIMVISSLISQLEQERRS